MSTLEAEKGKGWWCGLRRCRFEEGSSNKDEIHTFHLENWKGGGATERAGELGRACLEIGKMRGK